MTNAGTGAERALESRQDPRVARSCAAVLAAGDEILEEQGVRGITVEAVAHRSGVAKTTIYRHWPTKSDLILEIVGRQAFEFDSEDTSDPLEDLKAALQALSQGLAEPKRRLVLLGVLEMAALDPSAAAAHDAFLGMRGSRLQQVFRRAMTSARIPQGDTTGLTLQLLAAPVVFQALIYGRVIDRKGIDALVERVLGI